MWLSQLLPIDRVEEHGKNLISQSLAKDLPLFVRWDVTSLGLFLKKIKYYKYFDECNYAYNDSAPTPKASSEILA